MIVAVLIFGWVVFIGFMAARGLVRAIIGLYS